MHDCMQVASMLGSHRQYTQALALVTLAQVVESLRLSRATSLALRSTRRAAAPTHMQGFTSEGRVVANKHRNQSVAIMDISHCCACRCLYSLGSFLHISSYITAACSLFTAIAEGDDMYLQLHQEVHYNMFCMLGSWCSGRCAAYLK